MADKNDVAVIGAGSWGTALGAHLADKLGPVDIWCREQEVADGINSAHRNPFFLPDVDLPGGLHGEADLAKVVSEHRILVMVIPTPFTRDALKEIESRLEAIISVLQTAERALGSVDRSRLSTRLKTLESNADTTRTEARDRAARTAADLADVETRRDRQLAELNAIEGALDDLASALAPTDHEPAEEEIRRLAKTALLLRSRGISQ